MVTDSSAPPTVAPVYRPVWGLLAMIAGTAMALVCTVLIGSQLALLLDDIQAAQGVAVQFPSQAFLDFIGVALVVTSLLGILSTILMGVWMSKTFNALQRRGSALEGSAAGAFWWWFVPIANLYKPFQYLRRLWLGVTGGHRASPDQEDRVVRVMIAAWQSIWIASVILSAVARLFPSAVTIGDFIRVHAVAAVLFGMQFMYWSLAIALVMAVRSRFVAAAAE